MSSSRLSIASLPNEIFVSILASFSSQDLLRLVSVSRHFRLLVTRILHRRLLDTASLPDNELILECYHPSAKISTPYLTCRYLGLKTRTEPVKSEDSSGFADLRRLYSSFRPVVVEETRRWQWFSLSVLDAPQSADRQEDGVATQDVHLEDGELFSQLCAVTNVVKEGPRRGLFVSHINISDGVIRVWREWLAKRASETIAGDGDEKFLAEDETILWVDTAKSIGLRFRVTLGPCERMPLISGPGDESPVSYTLVYEEILVRTSKLLLAVEKSAVQEIAHSGKAIVIAAM